MSPGEQTPAQRTSSLAMRLRPWRMRLVLVSADLLAVACAWLLAMAIRLLWTGDFDARQFSGVGSLLILVPGCFWGLRLYAAIPSNPADELRRIAWACTLIYLMLAAGAFLAKQADVWSRAVWLVATGLTIVIVPLLRALVRTTCARSSWWGHPVVVLGAGLTGAAVINQLQRQPWLGLRPVAVLDDDPAKQDQFCCGVPVVGTLDEAPALARSAGIDHAVVAMPGASPQRLLALDKTAGQAYPHLIVIPPLVGFASMWVEPKDLGGVLGLEIRHRLLLPGPRLAKTILDWSVALLLMPFMAMAGLLIAVWIRLDSPGPILYRQKRIGLNGRTFELLKFRTMHGDGEAKLAALLAERPDLRAEYEVSHKLRNDPRVTRCGRWLRKLSLDEIPQFINLLRGELVLVGPRAYLEREVERIGDPAALIWRVKPGITGFWQVSGRNQTTFEERVQMDSTYVRNWSPWLDAWIIAKTFGVVLFGRGAY